MIIEEYQRDAGIVGEEGNIGCTFHIFVTKEFRRELRLHETIISLSGAGKSTLAEGVIKPFAKKNAKCVIDVVRLTGAALERSDSLDGKILLLSQSVGNEPTSIRPLLSEGKLGLMVTERSEDSNKFEAKIIEVKGMPVFCTTSTEPNMDPELLRRVVQRTVDESQEQTQRIKQKQAFAVSTVQLPRLDSFRLIGSILERIEKGRPQNIDQVIIPYADQIEKKLPDEIEIRSKLPQFLKLIQSIAIVKAVCYRGYTQLKMKKSPPIRVVIADVEDFNDALFMAGASFFHLIAATSQMIIDFLSSQIVRSKESLGEEYKKCTIRDIQQKLKIHASTIGKYANTLADQGLILKEQTTKGDTKIVLNLFQYLPGTIIDTGLKLDDFDHEFWFKSAIVDRGFQVTKLPIEEPLELDVFEQKGGMSETCVAEVKTPMSTQEKEVSPFQAKKTIEANNIVDSTKQTPGSDLISIRLENGASTYVRCKIHPEGLFHLPWQWHSHLETYHPKTSKGEAQS